MSLTKAAQKTPTGTPAAPAAALKDPSKSTTRGASVKARKNDGIPARSRPQTKSSTQTKTNRPMAALAVLIIVGSATAGAVLYSSAGDRHDVIALARDVPAGQKITAEDLRVAEVNGSGFSAVIKDHADQVVGSTAISNLPEGALLTNKMYQDDPIPEPGNVLVGASLKPGSVPSNAQPGRRVAVWKVGVVNGNAPVADAEQIVESALVTEVSTDVAGGNTLLSLDLPRDSAAAYTSAAAASTVAVSVLPVGS